MHTPQWILHARRLSIAVLGVAGILLAPAGPARAIALLDLLNGDSITAGDKTFDDWNLITNQILDQGMNVGTVDLSKIDVTSVSTDPLNPGLKYTAEAGVLSLTGPGTGTSASCLAFGGCQLDLKFDFTVTSSLGPIDGVSLELSTYTIGNGDGGNDRIDIIIEMLSGDPLVSAKKDRAFPVDLLLSDSAVIAPAQSSLGVRTDIMLFGYGEFTGEIREFTQHFSQIPVPEPGSLSLLGFALTGVGGLVGLRLRRKRGAAGPDAEASGT